MFFCGMCFRLKMWSWC